MRTEKFLLMLGLCKRAGAVIIGTPMVVKSLQEKKALTVFYACDSSANTEKKITDKCAYYGVECIKAPFSSLEISGAIGKSGAICALGITDLNFAGELKSLCQENS